jgi:hypothetical protein
VIIDSLLLYLLMLGCAVEKIAGPWLAGQEVKGCPTFDHRSALYGSGCRRWAMTGCSVWAKPAASMYHAPVGAGPSSSVYLISLYVRKEKIRRLLIVRYYALYALVFTMTRAVKALRATVSCWPKE